MGISLEHKVLGKEVVRDEVGQIDKGRFSKGFYFIP